MTYSLLLRLTRSWISRVGFLRNITSNNMAPIKTFVFLDLETTGLPHLEHNSTRITELCAVAVQADHIELGCFPRVHNKISLCFNPQKMISPESTNITGLSNHLLEHQMTFSSDAVEVIKKWLNMCQKPICFVAHNGSRFDFPIFRTEIERSGNCLPDDILCIDTLTAFKNIDKDKSIAQDKNTVQAKPKEPPIEFNDDYDEILSRACAEYEKELERMMFTPQNKNETTPKKQMLSSQKQSQTKNEAPVTPRSSIGHLSYKLGDLYTRLTRQPPIQAHEAEGDVSMLITSAASYGERFVAYANENAVLFSSTPVMKPGQRIGT